MTNLIEITKQFIHNRLLEGKKVGYEFENVFSFSYGKIIIKSKEDTVNPFILMVKDEIYDGTSINYQIKNKINKQFNLNIKTDDILFAKIAWRNVDKEELSVNYINYSNFYYEPMFNLGKQYKLTGKIYPPCNICK